MADGAPAMNRLAIDATLATRDALRYTPAGLPAIDLVLAHRSEQREAGGVRRVECEIAAVAFGAIAEAIAKLPGGAAVQVRGIPRPPLAHRHHARAARRPHRTD